MLKEEGSIVNQTLTALKTRLEENHGFIQIQSEEGFLFNAECTFNSPAKDEEIIAFEKKMGITLPQDYKAFLKITNGCRLFDEVESGGEIELYSLNQIIEYNEHYDQFEECFDIGYIYQDNIVINSKLYMENHNNYLYWKGHIDQFEEAIPLNMNFELWLDRFIISQGQKFWWWPIHTAENHYKL